MLNARWTWDIAVLMVRLLAILWYADVAFVDLPAAQLAFSKGFARGNSSWRAWL